MVFLVGNVAVVIWDWRQLRLVPFIIFGIKPVMPIANLIHIAIATSIHRTVYYILV